MGGSRHGWGLLQEQTDDLTLASTPKRAHAHAMDSSNLRLFHPATPAYSLDPSSPYDFRLHPFYLVPYPLSTHLLDNDSTPHDSFLGKRLFDMSTQSLDFFGTSPRKKNVHDLTHQTPIFAIRSKTLVYRPSTFYTWPATSVTQTSILVYRPSTSFFRPTTHVIRTPVQRLMTLLPKTSRPPRLTMPL